MLKSHVQTSLRPLLDIPNMTDAQRGLDGYRHIEIRAYDKVGTSQAVQIHFGETFEFRVIATFKPWEARELARYLVEAANTAEGE